MSPKSLGDFFENFEGKCMKFKEILFGLKVYFAIIFLFSIFAALIQVQDGRTKMNCDRFHIIEIIVPVVPVGCFLSKQVYP
jgi:hypothetical protein